ncbi:HEAT repeat domain-containing protein [Streptomyces sp. NPDC018029]|uniref:HEAT repeat domain-containing protein n=1 Tax=Streptomyces sp. NPDC018029 TaxID=3365032 RepID=UPI0037B2B7A2
MDAEDGLGVRLVSAVRAGDADAVRALLEEGADPDAVDAVDASGLSALGLAVAAYDAPVADVLVEGGADPDRALPDGTTPLWRAIDGGSYAVFSAVLGTEPRLRLPEATRERFIALARDWYETGVEEELRRRTGAVGPAVTERVADGEYDWVDQVSLGGLAVRAGHGGILTALEWAFRILTPVDDLVARAVRHPDEQHADWSAICWVLAGRRSHETWSAVVAHRHHRDPAHRRFVADYLRLRSFVDPGRHHYGKKETELLIAWAAEETDSAVLATVLNALTEYEHPDQEAVGLRHAGHPDPRVRREVPYTLVTNDGLRSPAARDAVLVLTRDPDVEVRLRACEVGADDEALWPEVTRALLPMAESSDAAARRGAAVALAASRDQAPAVAEALMSLLDEDDLLVRLEAAWGLARRDDPRTEEAYERVGPLGPGFEHDHRALELWNWRWRRQEADSPSGPAAD